LRRPTSGASPIATQSARYFFFAFFFEDFFDFFALLFFAAMGVPCFSAFADMGPVTPVNERRRHHNYHE